MWCWAGDERSEGRRQKAEGGRQERLSGASACRFAKRKRRAMSFPCLLPSAFCLLPSAFCLLSAKTVLLRGEDPLADLAAVGLGGVDDGPAQFGVVLDEARA